MRTETKKKNSYCNCNNQNECPQKWGNCTEKNIINETKLKVNSDNNLYIGLSGNQIRKRIAVHKTTIKVKLKERNYHKFVNWTYQKSRQMKEENKNSNIEWNIKTIVNRSKAGVATYKGKLCVI